MVDLHRLSGKGTLYFIRHGKSADHEAGLIKGRRDYPLSPAGIAQAEAAGVWFSRIPLDLILSSPLTRARETAEVIASYLSASAPPPEVVTVPELIEIDTGIFTGLTQEKAAAAHPEAFAAFQGQSWEGVPGAEKNDSLARRSTRFWDHVIGLVAEGHSAILSVLHKGIFQWIMHAVFGFPEWMPLFEIDFCGIYRLSFDTTRGRFYLIWDMLNATVQ
ncbi:MAG TPA: histidine phosphatase family protein [Spirochaetia bacterium]|nr:histidine phosphatase family protein [Spirochaetia bacterium]